MEGTWICPQCETSNENTDKCIVCGMDYASAVMAYKNIQLIQRLMHN